MAGYDDTIFGNLPARSSFDEAKHPRGQPENKGRFRSYAGLITVGTKDPQDMTHSERAKEHIRLSRHSTALGQQMIHEGRGSEKPTETDKKTDPLSQAIKAVSGRMNVLSMHHETYGDHWKHGQFLPQAPYEQFEPKARV
jgi:hypothetical protein